MGPCIMATRGVPPNAPLTLCTEIGIVIESEGTPNGIRTQKLDVCRLAIGYVAWVYEKAAQLDGVHRAARDQWPRASKSIPLNIAEGNVNSEASSKQRVY